MEDEIGTVRVVGFNDVATRFFKEETIVKSVVASNLSHINSEKEETSMKLY